MSCAWDSNPRPMFSRYTCRAGLFMLDERNFTSFIDMECINDPSGNTPIWNPPYDHDINPFPVCVPAGKLSWDSNWRPSKHTSIKPLCRVLSPQKKHWSKVYHALPFFDITPLA